MVARKPTAKRDKQKKTASAAGKPKKPTPVKKPAPAKQMKHVKKISQAFSLTESRQAPEPQIEDDEYNLQRGIQMSLESFQKPFGGVAFHEPASGNLDDAFTYGDQFLNDKPTEEEPLKANVETKVESMVTGPIYQASSSVPPLSTPAIIISSPKPVSPIQEPVFTATTTTLPPPPPLQ
nr:hypothetical protein [Tanacetum cinerariifolium]